MFNTIAEKNESNILTKDISCKCKCRFGDRICNSNPKWNNNKCWCECKKHLTCEKDYVWNPATCNCQNGKYLASIIDDSVIMCNGMIEETKTALTNFNQKTSCKTKHFYILRAFLLITIALLIPVSIWYYLIKYWAKQKIFITISHHNSKIFLGWQYKSKWVIKSKI